MEQLIKDRNIWIMDIEVLSNFYSYMGLNPDTQEIKTFVIYESRNDLLDLYTHFITIKGEIGFNNLGFDSQINQYIINNRNKWLDLSGEEIAKLIYIQSQKVIENSNKMGFSEFPEWKLRIPQLDLFKIWHYDNKAKMTSLKFLEYSMDFDNIEEMPIHHSSSVDESQIQSILDYNLNDIKATYEFYKITEGNTNHPLYKGIDKIQLRKDIQKEFGIKCLNFNDVKIGDNINKINYSKLSKKDIKHLPKPNKVIDKFKFKDCFPSYISFQTLEFNNFINAISNIDVNLKKETVKIKKQEFEFTYNGTTYLIAKGGIHSKDKPRIVKPLDNEILRDADIQSQYPNSIVKRKLFPKHLGNEWLIGYNNNIIRRIEAKKLFKKTKNPKYKSVDEVFKLALNGGGFGMLNQEHSWQYSPISAMCVTIGNQIEILMLIESLEIKGIHIISANTDGIVCLFDKSLEKVYKEVCIDWEIKVGNNKLGKLEYSDYKLLVQSSVNDYLAIKIDDIQPKCKGDFVIEFELHKNKSKKIVPLALQKYFIEGIKPEIFIKSHQNIFDFCLGCKSIGQNRLVHLDVKTNTELKLQKINRYYVSSNGKNLLKRLPPLAGKKFMKQLDIFGNINDGTRESEIEAGYLTTIYNKHIKQDINKYDLNYKYYIDCTNRIIDKIEGNGI